MNATSTSRDDLWLALKGGTNNFGIVTRITMRTFKLGGIYAGDIYYPPSTASQQFQAFSRFISDPQYDESAGIMQSWGFSDTQPAVIVNQIIYAQPNPDPPAFRPFNTIQPQLGNATNITTLTPYSKVLGDLSPLNVLYVFKLLWCACCSRSNPLSPKQY